MANGATAAPSSSRQTCWIEREELDDASCKQRRGIDGRLSSTMAEPPPLYKPEQCAPKKRLTLLQRCYMEPWIPGGASVPTLLEHACG